MKEQKAPVIGIIGGTGKFGLWFKSFFESEGIKVLIAGRKTELTPKELARKSDIVIISVPINKTIKIIKEIRGFLRAGALLTDFTSIKEKPMAEMLKTDKKIGVTGMHPLFGPLVYGMRNQNIVFVSGRDNHWTKFFKNLFEKKGAKIISISAQEHDRQMAIVQAMTHFVNIAFMGTIHRQKLKPLNLYSTPIFRIQSLIAGRILGGDAGLYSDLEIENEEFLKIIDDFMDEANMIIKFIKEANRKEFANHFDKIAAALKTFIPVAQAKSSEIINFIDQQPIDLKHPSKARVCGGKSKISFLGPEGTYSHIATSHIFSKGELTPVTTIKKVFESVLNGESILGVVPAENSTEGLVQETIDSLIKFPLEIIGSYKLPIHHCLLARTNNKNKIKIIRSHPQPIAQSRNWLSENFPKAVLETDSSSVKAILSTKDLSVAFIGSHEAAKKYNLAILAENIEDKKNNITEFYVISKNRSLPVIKRFQPLKTLMVLSIYDRPGVLRDILNCFAKEKINLSKLHSKISDSENWDYYFLIEVETLPGDSGFKRAMTEIKKFCSVVRILGVI